MIEQNILKLLQLGDSIQKIDVYNKKYIRFIFKLNYILSKQFQFSIYFHIIIIILFFGQIWELNLQKVEIEGDDILEIINYLEKIFIFNKIINNIISYKIITRVVFSLCILLLCIIILNTILLITNKEIKFLIALSSLINIIICYYLNGPLLQILLYSTVCHNGNHIYLNIQCSKNKLFLISIIIKLIFVFVIIIYIIYVSLYFNDINCINGSNVKSKINSNYTTIILIIKIIYFFLEYFLNFYLNNNKVVILLYYFIFCLINILISFYVYKKVYYYNNIINILHHYGWYYSSWFSICILLKVLLGIKDLKLIIIFGLILITFGLYFNNKYKEFKLLTELNILKGNSLKDIEEYNEILINLSKSNSHKNRTLIAGVIKRFEEYLSNNVELNDHYNKFINDKHLQKIFSSYNELKILSMISIIYTYNIEKSEDATDLTLNKCYFLINKFKNITLAIWLCTKIKKSTHIQSYYKYVLMEEIKEYLIKKLNKSINKLSLKHIQISSVILYNQYVELFKVKIYDATCSQIDYFDILKNSVTNSKSTDDFLKLGEDILSLKEDILSLWEKILYLNPFSNESEKDYLMYLDSILHDNVLLEAEIKRYNTFKAKKMPEKNNEYYSMFIQELNAVLLVDGYSYNGKIIYATPNFPSLFMFTGKEILNICIDDLLPDVIQTFHKYLIEDAIKYSNLSYIFKNKKNALLKGKNGIIYNIDLFIKPVPNISFGLIYFIYIQKIQESNLIIILNDNFYINGFTEINQVESNFIMNDNYGLSQSINGYHIGLIIPEILLQMDYNINSNSFDILKDNMDIKGYLYPIHNLNIFDDKIKKILDIIKEKKIAELNNENIFTTFEEYDELIKELKRQHPTPFSIFFKIESHSFIGGKYKYYTIYITKDLLFEKESVISSQLNTNILPKKGNNYLSQNNNNYLKQKNKDINEDSSIYNSSIDHSLIFKNVKIKLNRQSKILIKDKVNNLNKELLSNKDININKEALNNEKKNKQKSNNINFKQNNRDLFPIQLITESAELNNLKKEIFNKNDSFYIKLIKIISYIYIVLIIGLIVFDYISIKKKLNNAIEFLKENIYFPYTKITIACIYNSAINIKLIREKIIQNDKCPIADCSQFYADLLKKCYSEVRVQKYDIGFFFPDYLKIFQQRLHAELFILNRTDAIYLNLDIDSFLNLIIGQGFKIIANFTDFFNEDPQNQENRNILNVYLRNMIVGSLKFFYSDYIGFSGKEKENRCDEISYNSPLANTVSVFLFVIFILIISYLILHKNNMEIFLLDKLINFNSTDFDEYLKQLKELKKKFRDDSNDEDERDMDDFDLGDNELDVKNKDNFKDNVKNTNIKKKIVNNKENTKEKKIKQGKIQEQKLKKRKIMSDYFIKYNIYFGIKICIIFFFSIIYFLISKLMFEKMKKNYKEFDSTIEKINQVYFESFQTFLIFKEQVEIFHRTKDKSNLIIPKDTEINLPTIGNSLMYLTRSTKYSSESLEIFDKLYNNDACEVLAQNDNEYNYCQNIFSSILTKGLGQAIVQMDIIITNVIDELNTLKNNNNLEKIYTLNSSFFNYEMFIGYYMLESFLLTQTFFDTFRKDEKYSIDMKNYIFLVIFVIIFIFLMICLFWFTYTYKKIENSFLNFIGILPSKFIADDKDFYKAIFRLSKYFY